MITKAQILALTIVKDSKPWVKIVNTTRNPNDLKIVKDAKTWWGYARTAAETGNVKRILKVDWPYVKTIINVEG